MSTKPFFSGRIPQNLYDALEAYRQRTNESKTDILIQALSRYIDHPVELSTSPNAVEASRVESLEKKFEVLKQELQDLRSLLITPSTSPVLENRKVETIDQIPVVLEDVINSDNNLDNTSELSNKSNKDDSQSVDNNSDNKEDNKKEILPGKVFVGTLKTVEVLQLPGLENEDPKKLKNKVSNTKQSKTQTAQIGPYMIVLSSRPEVSDRKRQELFWDVYKSENELVISNDNNADN
jgi:hypothetical protein